MVVQPYGRPTLWSPELIIVRIYGCLVKIKNLWFDLMVVRWHLMVVRVDSCLVDGCLLTGVWLKVANPYAVVTLFKASHYCGFWWYFITKIWSVDHIIIVMFIIECATGGLQKCSKFMCVVQWWYFFTLAVMVTLFELLYHISFATDIILLPLAIVGKSGNLETCSLFFSGIFF